MADQLLSEVDADLRAAQIDALWSRNKKKLALFAFALVLGTALYTAYDHFEKKRGGERMLALTQAQALFAKGSFAEAANAFAAQAENSRGDARTLALLWQGRALVSAGEKANAVAVLTQASAASPSVWSDLACLRLSYVTNTNAECLGSTKHSPLENQRRAWHAAFLQQSGDHAKAAAILEELTTSDTTPEATRAELSEWLATVRATKKPTP